jgi:Tfp pilus assembly protein PilN
MKRLLILLVVIMAVILVKRRNMETPALTQEQTIEALKKEIKQLKQSMAENESIVGSR